MVEKIQEITEKEKERRRKISEFRKKYLEEKRILKYREYVSNKKKKKVGRPKKRGPKKKRKSRAKKPIDKRTINTEYKQFNFKLVSCHNGKQNRYIGIYRTEKEAMDVLSGLMIESSIVEFKQQNTSGKKISDSEYAYLLLERNRNGGLKDIRQKNKFGIIVDQKTNSEKWVIVHKEFYNVEETFWVFGRSPKDRKTYRFVFDELLMDGIVLKQDFKRVLQYKNKIVFKNDDGTFDIILCKNTNDAVRMYNKLMKDIHERKIKNVCFIGSYDEINDKRRELEYELIKYTGWNKKKIQKSTT